MHTPIRINPGPTSAYDHMIAVDGLIAGTWKKIINNKTIGVETNMFNTLAKAKQQAVMKAVNRYQAFAGNKPGNKNVNSKL